MGCHGMQLYPPPQELMVQIWKLHTSSEDRGQARLFVFLCVGGTDGERKRNSLSSKSVSQRRKVQAASPVGLQHGCRAELACISECICVCEVGVGMQMKLMCAHMSVGLPCCLYIHYFILVLRWLTRKQPSQRRNSCGRHPKVLGKKQNLIRGSTFVTILYFCNNTIQCLSKCLRSHWTHFMCLTVNKQKPHTYCTGECSSVEKFISSCGMQ